MGGGTFWGLGSLLTSAKVLGRGLFKFAIIEVKSPTIEFLKLSIN